MPESDATPVKPRTAKAAEPESPAPLQGSAAHVKYVLEELFYSLAKGRQRSYFQRVGDALSTVDRLAAAAQVNIEDVL